MSEDDIGFSSGIDRAHMAVVPTHVSVQLDKEAGDQHVPKGGYMVASRSRPQVRVEKYDGGRLIAAGITQAVPDQEGGVSMVVRPDPSVGANNAFEQVPQPTGRLPSQAVPDPVFPVTLPVQHTFQVQPVVAQAPAPAPRKRVTLSGEGIGKMTLFCSGLAISDSLVVIQYPSDGQTSIYEPPVCTDENPLTVSEGINKYQCISGGWSVEINGQYLVMLPRLPDAP